MNWIDKCLQTTRYIQNTQFELETVYFDGSRHLKRLILKELENDNPWVNVSKLSFKHCSYSDDLLKKLMACRFDNKIYKNSNASLEAKHFISKCLSTIEHLTPQIIDNVFIQCCELLNKTCSDVIIIAIDCTSAYFHSKGGNNLNRLIIHTIRQLALINNKFLLPYCDIYIACDSLEDGEDINVVHTQNLTRKLASNLKIQIHPAFNKDVVKKMLLHRHKSVPLTEDDIS